MDTRTPTSAEVAVAELKQAVQDLVAINADLAEDYYLIRWLKARGMNVKKAETMIREATKWRETVLKDLLTLQISPELIGIISSRTPKTNMRNGGVVEYAEFYDVDLKSVIHQYGKEQVRSYSLYEFLMAEKANLKWDKQVFLNNGIGSKIPLTENSVSGNVLIVDCSGLSVKDIMSVKCITLLYQLSGDVCSYFPPHVATCIVINCPTYALHLIKFLRTVVKNTVDLQVYDSNEEVWKEVLLRYADADNLPVKYGGKMEFTKTTRLRW